MKLPQFKTEVTNINIPVNRERINAYLWYSYLPPTNYPKWIDDFTVSGEESRNYTVEEASSKFDVLFNSILSKQEADKHIVLLSGGWDSRAILGALLERYDTTQIEAVSFGVPGQLDYDLGNMIAKKMEVKHHPIDLRTINLSWELIVSSVQESPWTYVPDCLFNKIAREVAGDDNDAVWVGFLGDPLAGSHLHNYYYDTIQYFDIFVNNQKCVTSYSLFNTSDYDPRTSLPSPPQHTMCLNDLVEFGIRQAYCIAPIIAPIEKWRGWGSQMGYTQNNARVFAPFADKRWADYWLFAPRELRHKQRLYLEMLRMKFPYLFSLPGTVDLGVPRNKKLRYITRRINHGIRKRIFERMPFFKIRSSLKRQYIDVDEMVRRRRDYRETFFIAFDYLRLNQIVPWINLDKIWNNHFKRRKDYGDAFEVLLGLAANLSVHTLHR